MHVWIFQKSMCNVYVEFDKQICFFFGTHILGTLIQLCTKNSFFFMLNGFLSISISMNTCEQIHPKLDCGQSFTAHEWNFIQNGVYLHLQLKIFFEHLECEIHFLLVHHTVEYSGRSFNALHLEIQRHNNGSICIAHAQNISIHKPLLSMPFNSIYPINLIKCYKRKSHKCLSTVYNMIYCLKYFEIFERFSCIDILFSLGLIKSDWSWLVVEIIANSIHWPLSLCELQMMWFVEDNSKMED